MGIFTNYKKKIEYEKQQWEIECEQYKFNIEKMRKKIKVACNEYNQEVATINSERSSLKEPINKLYDFLKDFGEIGSKITPFDFVNESWQLIDVDALINSENVHEFSKGNSKNATAVGIGVTGIVFSATAIANVAILLNPIMMLPVVAIPKLIDIPSKKDYMDYKVKHNSAIFEYNNNMRKLEDVHSSIVLAKEIARIYYGIIGAVKESITKTIIPELVGIKAFLYANTVASKIAEGVTLTHGIEPADIKEFEGTKYNDHFIFLKNTVDYYILIVTIFTKQILTKMFEDYELTEYEKAEFKKQIKQIEEKKEILTQNAHFE